MLSFSYRFFTWVNALSFPERTEIMIDSFEYLSNYIFVKNPGVSLSDCNFPVSGFDLLGFFAIEAKSGSFVS